MKKEQIEKLKRILPIVPGLNGREEYVNSAVLVLLIFINNEYHLVFQKRASKIRQGGEVCFPGGQNDPEIDMDYEHTAIRETVEEMGIPKEKLSIIGQLDTLVAPMGALIRAFVGIAEINGLEEFKIDHNEVEYIFTVPLSYIEKNKPDEYQAYIKTHPSYFDKDDKEVVVFPARELGLPEKYFKPWGERKYKIYVYKVEEEIIWGATARIVYDLAQRLNPL